MNKPNLSRIQDSLSESYGVAIKAEEVGQLYNYKDKEHEYKVLSAT